MKYNVFQGGFLDFCTIQILMCRSVFCQNYHMVIVFTDISLTCNAMFDLSHKHCILGSCRGEPENNKMFLFSFRCYTPNSGLRTRSYPICWSLFWRNLRMHETTSCVPWIKTSSVVSWFWPTAMEVIYMAICILDREVIPKHKWSLEAHLRQIMTLWVEWNLAQLYIQSGSTLLCVFSVWSNCFFAPCPAFIVRWLLH